MSASYTHTKCGICLYLWTNQLTTPMLRLCLFSLCFCLGQRAWAQEFPKGFSLPIELGQGFNQPAGSAPLYLLTLQAVPQFTLVPGHLRLGAVVGGYYPATQVGILAGPRLTVKLLQGAPALTASSYNLHLLAEYLWATTPATTRQLLGGGIGVGSSDLLTVSLKLHRDLHQPATFFQFSLGYNVSKQKIPVL